MTHKIARRLHNGDEVILKSTGELGVVLAAYPDADNPKRICVQVNFPHSGFVIVSHLEIV